VIARVVAASMVRSARTQTAAPDPSAAFASSTIVASAICEGAGLLSAMVFFITGQQVVLLAFAIAMGAMLTVRPTDDRFAQVQSELGG
jgi:hypothetical protein